MTHDLPVAYELCERVVILDKGRVVADGPTREILADAELLAAHDLELPYGFAPAAAGRSLPLAGGPRLGAGLRSR